MDKRNTQGEAPGDLAGLGEDRIIELFSGGTVRPPVITAIGDDCAVIGPYEGLVFLWTADMLIEGVHFIRSEIPPEDLGYKSLCVNLSDIAAMGGEPLAALISLSLPKDLPSEWIERFRDGVFDAGEKYHCQIAGGDTCGSRNSAAVSITVLGKAVEQEVLRRSGTHTNDDIWLSGRAGLSALGLELLNRNISNDGATGAFSCHFRPEPQLELGRFLAENRLASSCIDTSDGLVIDLGRICRINNCSATIFEKQLPIVEEARSFDLDPIELALHGGEDYQLLFTAEPGDRARLEKNDTIQRIGSIEEGTMGITLIRKSGEEETIVPRGFSHF
jgi:thiamine-monophosphate kinase